MRRFQFFRVSRVDGTTTLELLPPAEGFRFVGAALAHEFEELARDEQPAYLIIDLGRVHCSSTEVINALVAAKRAISHYGGRLALCGLSPNLYQSLQTLRLVGSVLPVCERAGGNGMQGTERT